MHIIDEGHVYDLTQLGGGTQRLTFVKRSGGAIKYDDEFPGVQTQEVLRALIDRTDYLNDILPCTETQDAIYYLRMALYMYEVRAWRRKMEQANKTQEEHDDTLTPKSWRPFPHEVPFTEHEIELTPTGSDGHIVVDDTEVPL